MKRILLGALAVVALAAAVACGEEASPASDDPTAMPGARTEDPAATPMPSTAIRLSGVRAAVAQVADTVTIRVLLQRIRDRRAVVHTHTVGQ